MSVSAIVTVAERIANGERVSFPAMQFADWELFIRCVKEAQNVAKS